MKEQILTTIGVDQTKYLKGWTRLEDLPVAIDYNKLIYYNNYLYSIGGGATTITNTIQRYSLDNDTWEIISPTGTLPLARRLHGTVLIDDYIYIYGGYNGSTYYSDLWQYDLINDSWIQKTSDQNRRTFISFEYNKELYVMGGYNSNSTVLSNSRIYNPNNNQWRNGQSLPFALLGSSYDLKNDALFFYGGSTNGISYRTTLTKFDINQNTFTNLQNRSPNTYYGAGAIIDNYFYSFGNLNSSATLNNVFCRYNINTGIWEDIPLLENEPTLRSMTGICSFKDCLFIAGSYESAISKEFWVYKP